MFGLTSMSSDSATLLSESDEAMWLTQILIVAAFPVDTGANNLMCLNVFGLCKNRFGVGFCDSSTAVMAIRATCAHMCTCSQASTDGAHPVLESQVAVKLTGLGLKIPKHVFVKK